MHFSYSEVGMRFHVVVVELFSRAFGRIDSDISVTTHDVIGLDMPIGDGALHVRKVYKELIV